MHAVLAKPAFTCEGVTATLEDVVAHARARWAWGRWEDEVGHAMARELAVPAPGRDRVRDAATDFRRARRLIAGEELAAWLDAWGLTPGGWLAWVRRSLLDPGPAPVLPPRFEDVWADAVCAGKLEREAWAMAERAAAAAALGTGDADPVEALAERALTEGAIVEMIAAAGLDWTRFTLERVMFRDAGTAAEAVLCVREDGVSLAAAAAMADTTTTTGQDFLEDLPPEVGAALVGAAAGDLRTIAAAGGHEVVRVIAREPADAQASAVRARARDRVARRAVAREVASRVRWHAPLEGRPPPG